MANRLVSAAWGPTNIIAAASVYTYTATKTCTVRFFVYLGNAAGGGDYVVYLTKRLLGAGNTYTMLPKTTCTAAAGETTIGMMTISVDVYASDVVNVMVDGLAGDGAVSGSVEVYEDDYIRPNVAGQYNVDVDANGGVEVGAIQNNVITNNAIATDAIGADELATSAVTEIVNAIVAHTYFAGITSLAAWLGALAGMTTDAATLAQINATTAGATYNNTTDSLEALRNWLSAATTISVVSVIAGGRITVRPYTTWTINISGLGSLVGRTKLWFDVKDDPATQDDDASFLRVEETAGLQRINGAAGVGANATLVVTDAVAGNITVTVNKSQTGIPPRAGRVWQVKMGIAAGADTVITEGEFNVGQTVTRTTA